jgi:peptidoglycan/xylan/chitin deacetylase (PgdA/CDA1 family)
MRFALSLASPGGRNGKLSILIFHRVLPEPDPLFPGEVDRIRFDEICGWLRRWFNVMPLDHAYRRLMEGDLPERAMSITFDDGYRDNAEIALPVLQAHQLTATFFVATGFLDDGCMWNDRIVEAVRCTSEPWIDLNEVLEVAPHRLPLAGIEQRRAAVQALLPAVKYLSSQQREEAVQRIERLLGAGCAAPLMMNARHVQLLSESGMSVGVHTVTHPILSLCTEDQVRRELGDCRASLQSLLQRPVTWVAYPNGVVGRDVGPREFGIVRELGFEAAVSTEHGFVTAGSERFALRRFTPWDQSRLRFGLRLVRNLSSGKWN